MSHKQRTLKKTARFDGIGLHSGCIVEVEVRPAAAGTGILFRRSDIPNSQYFKATADSVLDTTLATKIGPKEASLSTVEHLLAAFFGLGIDNAIVSCNSFEVPILDGSAASFLMLLNEAEVVDLPQARKVLVIKKPVEVVDPRHPDRFVRVEPARRPRLSYAIDFSNAPSIGKQQFSVEYSPEMFCRELSFARTFCVDRDIEMLRSRGLARGGTLENAVVARSVGGLENLHGLRCPDEFVRHKALDCVGDLMLLGMPILGHIIASRAGHELHTALALKLSQELAEHKVLVPSAKEALALSALLEFPERLKEPDRLLALSAVRG